MSDKKKIGKQTQPKGHSIVIIIIIAWDDETMKKKSKKILCDQNKTYRKRPRKYTGKKGIHDKNNCDKYTSRHGNGIIEMS